MAAKRFQGDHARCRDRADGSCTLAMVRRLSEERVRELAEDIWTASTGTVVPARRSPDPRSSRPGVSAETAYRRRRQQEREAWRPGWPQRARIVAGASRQMRWNHWSERATWCCTTSPCRGGRPASTT